jgi:predicted acylesterase/phospholipase RssA/CRP-like cAMP-binding protein
LKIVERRQLSTALHRNVIFASLPLHVLRDLADELQERFVAGGETLFRQGDRGDALYLVVSGRLQILRETPEGPSVIGELGPGETVGEIAILGGEKRLATVAAIRDTQLASLSKDGFQRILGKHALIAAPFFARQLVSIATRPPQSSASATQARSVAVAAVSPGFALRQFAVALTSALSGENRVLHLTSQLVDESLGDGMAQMLDWNPRHRNLLIWLNNKEQEYDCVVYETDATKTPWTERCLRQADRILLVADACATEGLVPAGVLRSQSGRQLVSLALIHEPDRDPENTAAWLHRYPVTQHHHLRMNCQSDFERLARFLTGRAIGVALGGGFARGISHAGVIRAIRELKIPVDAIGGTSMGSLIALQYVYGYTWQDMIDVTSEGGIESLRDWTLPLVALLHGKRARRVVSSRSLGKQMEDLWLPCFTVATNLTSAKLEALYEGPVDEAILASSRVPGMLPPIVRGRDLLVDGGLMSNVPADVMKSFGAGTIIAVDVSSNVDFAAFRSEHSDVSGWKVLFDRLRRGVDADQTPTIISVLMRAMELDTEAYRQRMKSLSDLYLMPPVQKYRFNDFKLGRKMAEEAYVYAYAELARWLARRQGSHDLDTVAVDVAS